MQNQQLIEYIKSEKLKGTGYEIIKSNLVNNGWALSDIESAWAGSTVKPDGVPLPPKLHINDNTYTSLTPGFPWRKVVAALFLLPVIYAWIYAIFINPHGGEVGWGALIATNIYFILVPLPLVFSLIIETIVYNSFHITSKKLLTFTGVLSFILIVGTIYSIWSFGWFY